MEIQRVFMCRVPTPNVCQTFGHQIINEFHWSMNSSKNFRLKMHSRQKFSFKQIYSFNNIFSKMYSVPKSSSCTISSQKTFRSFYPHRKKIIQQNLNYTNKLVALRRKKTCPVWDAALCLCCECYFHEIYKASKAEFD